MSSGGNGKGGHDKVKSSSTACISICRYVFDRNIIIINITEMSLIFENKYNRL